jgi:aromatic-amino-acid transaminase
MANFLMAEQNGRTIPKGDKIFGINMLAKDLASKIGKENVINSTIGSLLDDEGNLLVLPTVVEILRGLKPVEYADYAPIAGVPAFLESAKKSAFGEYFPEGYMDVIATPGGTGSIRSTIQNYSKRFDKVLTTDWYWSPYHTIAGELERTIETFAMFDEKGNFNITSLEKKMTEMLKTQDSLIFLFNAPAHNPTGYNPSLEEWDSIVDLLKEKAKDLTKKIIFFVDIAYIHYAGDAKESRKFLPKLGSFPDNVLVIFGFSMSKAYTLYGMRSGASICLSQNKAIVEEFNMVSMYSNRGTWSNGTRPAMLTLAKIHEDKTLYDKVIAERAGFSQLLDSRCKGFFETANQVGLKACPFDAGFFITIPCLRVDEVINQLQSNGIFTVPMDGGIRIAISAIKESEGRKLATTLAGIIKNLD